MADVRDILINLIGRETVSGAAKKAADGVDKLGDEMRATSRDADRLDAEIKQAEKALADLATQYARTDDAAKRVDLTKSMRKQQTEIRRLIRSRDIVRDAVKSGEDAGTGFGVAMVGRIGPFLTKMPLGPVGAGIGGVLAAGLVPILGAAVGGAVLGGVGAGGVIGGIALAARDSRVQAAGKQLGQSIMGDLDDASSMFVQPTIRGIGIISDAWDGIAGDIEGTFRAASRYVEPLSRGVAGLARELGPALRRGVEAAAPVIREISEGLPRVGAALGDLMDTFAENADEGASAMRLIFQWAEAGIGALGTMLGIFSDTYRVLVNLADVASLYAEALYGRLPIIGDRVKENRERILELKGALEEGGEAGWTAGERAAGGIRKVGEAAATATPPVKTFAEFLGESVGRAFDQEEASIRAAAAYRNLGDAAKEGKNKGIDPHTEAGERNRRALLDAARAAKENSAKILEVTGNHELAEAATEEGRRKFLEAADAMGVEKKEAINLANKLFGIPKNVKSKAEFDSKAALAKLQTYNNWLKTVDRDVYNRVITETVTRRSARGGHQEFAHGGVVRATGPRGVDSELIRATPGEGVLSLPEMDQLGGEAGFERLRAAIRGGSGRPAVVGSYASNASGATVVHNTFQIAVNVPPTADLAEVGRLTVKAITEHERRNGAGWRNG